MTNDDANSSAPETARVVDPLETRRIVAIAAPLTAAYAAEMGMVITDMIIVGRLGSRELAAVGLTGDLFWILLLMGMGVIAMVGVIAAQCYGADDRDGVVAAGEQGMIVATILSLVAVPVLYVLIEHLRERLSGKPASTD